MTEETKTKVEKWIYRAAITLGVAGAVFAVYSYGKDSGYDEGYAAGYDDGHGSEGMKNEYERGLRDSAKMHLRWLYDPFTYNDANKSISQGLMIGQSLPRGMFGEKTLTDLDNHLGEGWSARVAFVRKPSEYDDIPHTLPNYDDEENKDTVDDYFKNDQAEEIEEVVK